MLGDISALTLVFEIGRGYLLIKSNEANKKVVKS